MTALGRSSVRHIVALPERGEVVELSWHGVTHTGYRRAGNEDSYLADVPLFAVADGMGGHSHGDRASGVACIATNSTAHYSSSRATHRATAPVRS